MAFTSLKKSKKNEDSMNFDDFLLRLNPLDRLSIYEDIVKILSLKYKNGLIDKDRFNEILLFVKKSIVDVKTVKEARDYVVDLDEKFPEFKGVGKKFFSKDEEQFDKVLSEFVEILIEKGDLENVELVLKFFKDVKNDLHKAFYEFSKKFPKEFSIAISKINFNNQ